MGLKRGGKKGKKGIWRVNKGKNVDPRTGYGRGKSGKGKI